ncbi:hypothetical protein R52603_02445 [Paraburkholderia saeva]|uniref:Uncharacterized protein n=1 Tax=Paraburkholderia saeva TaxID=2777537 RepID=A0A9N8X3L6_9BURK|nr:hypothetical protein [Paraburkholderia saeva]CAG4890244.1 hypothetical protein R70241_00994 [Paraburkholderia saeva]CAG4898351.1 hypothetical protein R52603_02445 [Paraburkholderia saeva]CAG4911628.1 hypothetical protein LMG31841_04085 [Paraburkholderia saeva]
MPPTGDTPTDGESIEHRIFRARQLSIGLTLPLPRKGHIVADFGEQIALAPILREARESGTHHVTLNVPASPRAPRDVIEELAAHVLPEFHYPGTAAGP